uniref:Uncharacterized protein n=1 Tax=Romanomermis culicivorax TaxID=13658 RepID=A0A915JC18_ROMCU
MIKNMARATTNKQTTHANVHMHGVRQNESFLGEKLKTGSPGEYLCPSYDGDRLLANSGKDREKTTTEIFTKNINLTSSRPQLIKTDYYGYWITQILLQFVRDYSSNGHDRDLLSSILQCCILLLLPYK